MGYDDHSEGWKHYCQTIDLFAVLPFVQVEHVNRMMAVMTVTDDCYFKLYLMFDYFDKLVKYTGLDEPDLIWCLLI